MADLAEASTDKVTTEHGVIDEAIQDRGEGYTVFSIVRSAPSRHFPNEATYFVLSSIARRSLVSSFGEQIEEREAERLSGKGCEWTRTIGDLPSFSSV